MKKKQKNYNNSILFWDKLNITENVLLKSKI